jgi:N-formylglutamate deformylase
MSRTFTHRAFRLTRPRDEGVPLVFDSPHSGFEFPRDFRPAASRAHIRTSWDAYVDELCAGVTDAGATLLAARFPRAYIDANRAADDISPDVLLVPWPGTVRLSENGRRGMGLVRGVALPGIGMYRRRLTVGQVTRRIEHFYTPYRHALRESLDAAHQRHGVVWHFNCHSMKSFPGERGGRPVRERPDFVISDDNGATAPPMVTSWVAEFFSKSGYRVTINDPYRGADIIRSHGKPRLNRYSIQIEINRSLYMHERTCRRHRQFTAIQSRLTEFAHAVAKVAVEEARLNRTHRHPPAPPRA